MPGLCVRGVGFCSVCQGFERCVHALKACMVHGARNRPRCGVCGHKLVKNGQTSAGRTRWRCRACGASRVINRPDATRRAQASLFVSWLLTGVCVKQLAMPTTSFARKVSWCWQVDPPQPLITGEIYDQIIIDGIYLSHHWCLLIATNGSHVIGWQWCDRESVAAWQALLSRFPASTVVVTDGGPGALKAIRHCWPATGVQRCLFHVWLNTKTDLTGHRKPLLARHYCASEATSPPSTLSTKPPHEPPNSTIDGTLTGISPANEPTTPAGNQDNNTGGTPTTGFDAPTCA